MRDISKSLKLQERAQVLIPGKTQLLSKRPEMFAPGQWPGYYSKAKGQEIWDVDGNKYFDFSIGGIGANILGYADDEVDHEVIEKIGLGSSSTFNPPEEVELAEEIKNMHPWIDMVRYARSGGESVAIAVRIARAYTKREKILFCGYHGWHDWYLSTNLESKENLSKHLLSGLSAEGVPKVLQGTSIPFQYNQIEEFLNLLDAHKNQIAAVVMEPTNSNLPTAGYLEEIRRLSSAHGIVLIFDEISSAFRINFGGVHEKFGINPDLVIFAKAISNGYPMSVVGGRKYVMESAQDTFISSTSWTERLGPTAALATVKKYKKVQAQDHLVKIGEIVRNGWKSAADAAGLNLQIEGLPSISRFKFEDEKDLTMKTFFTQEMLNRGFLASGRFYSMYAHSIDIAERYVRETEEIFCMISELMKSNRLESELKGEIAHAGFKRLN